MPEESGELTRVVFKDIYSCFLIKDKFEENVIMIVDMHSVIYTHIFRRYQYLKWI